MTLWSAFLMVDVTLLGLLTAAAVLVSRAPGWRELRPYAWAGASATVYCSTDLASSLVLDGRWESWAGRFALTAAAVHLSAWFRFAAVTEKRRPEPLERALGVALLVVGGLALVPGLVVSDMLLSHRVPVLGAVFADPHPTVFGELTYAVLCGAIGVLIVHFLGQLKKGLPFGRVYLAVLCLLLGTAVNDSLVASGVYPGPYLTGVGLVLMMAALGYVLARRFLGYASSLQVLSSQLERTVEQRTQALTLANQALLRAEKLAAVGQLAAGVAHEINNPAAVIKGNLTFLKEELEDLDVAPELNECIDDSLTAVARVARIVRELLSAGRVAGRTEAKVQPFALAEAIDGAATLAAPILGTSRVQLKVQLPPSLGAVGQAELVSQVLANLINNAAQAISAGGVGSIITLSAERRDGSTCVAVEDDGPGISPQIQGRVFEPFFTTKPVGQGTGLGLAVSIGLMGAQGGTLVLAHSGPGRTRFELTLPWAEAPEQAELTPAGATRRSLRVLLVDDEPSVLAALQRALRAAHQVETANGVRQALDRIKQQPDGLDAVICDVAMPDGGGEGLFEAICQSAPRLAERTFFITGGALSHSARAFIEQHRNRVLLKPFDSQQLFRLLEALPA